MDGTARLAKMFKERENQLYLGPQLGLVINPPPEVQIGLGERIILTKEQLIFAAHVLADYQRDIEIPLTGNVSGGTTSVPVGEHGSHAHNYVNIGIQGQLRYTDTLQAGDQVILVPTTDEQLYFVVDKAVRI